MLNTILAAICAGVVVISLSSKLGIPAIALLLITGVSLGPYGLGLIQPSTMGEGLLVLTQIAVGIILFHGGLELRPEGYRRASTLIRRMLSVGVIVGWIATSVAIHFIMDFGWGGSFLAGSLVIVTGPTVIMPILRRIRVRQRLHHTLLWEGVLIDPIGVFLAAMCFEIVVTGTGGLEAVYTLGVRLAAGTIIGILGGLLAAFALRKDLITAETRNVFVLAIATLVFGLCEAVAHESGLLGVMIAGFLLALLRPPHLHEIEKFKGEISELLISILFVLLSANLDLSAAQQFGLPAVLTVMFVILVSRPLAVMASSIGLGVEWREKAFLSWVAPRGIVAASMASLFAQSLADQDPTLSQFLEIFTFSVIAVTVVAQGMSAPIVARWLKLREPDPQGWAIIGAHSFARGIAKWMQDNLKVPVLLIDTNSEHTNTAIKDGLHAIQYDATDPQVFEHETITEIGNILALTDNERINELACRHWSNRLRSVKTYRWATYTDAEWDQKGSPIWVGTPAPSVLSAELDQKLISWVFDEEHNETDPSMQPTMLLTLAGDNIEFGPPAAGRRARNSLALLHRGPEIASYIQFESCGTLEFAQQASRNEALHSLVTQIAQHEPVVDVDATCADLDAREASFSTAIGKGVALPHTYVEGLAQPVIAFGVAKEGVEYSTPDGQMVTLIVLLLSPPGNPGQHLQILSEIAQMASDGELIDRISAASDGEEMARLVRWSYVK